ncbi:MAG: T9SS type A sorting domain-containing protein, partial [Deinococcales bacterium]|nr:T9SS type A sorting domain-containing protein [Chitinophagaceae bacterium]
RCFTVQQIKIIRANNPNIETDAQFEAWLSPLVNKRKQNRLPVQNYTLPVIFHIVHNSETQGSGNNIATSRIQAQILQLNKDYANLSGSPYAAAVASGVQFALATKNPTGGLLAEPGIDRINRNTKGWTASPYTAGYVDSIIKPNSFWDPSRYINIWLVDMSNEGILGFATFPGSSSLTGLDNSETDETAGLAIDPTTVGSIFSSSSCGSSTNPYTLGRTLTHEIGHFFGLRHIWGDQDPAPCSDDFCADTPLHFSENYGKPQHPKANSCGTADEMFENYMDYTDDDIVNTFTADQVDRIQTVLINSPRRKTLSASNAGFSTPTGSNKIAFAICSGSLNVLETGTTGTTSRYRDIPVVINVEKIATGAATVTFNVTGTAINNVHYQLSATSVTFAINDASKSINVRVLDNATNDGNKTITLNYNISGTGVTANSTGQALTITIADDDNVVISNNPVAILSQNFETNTSGWSNISIEGINVFTTSTNGDAGGSGSCAHITSNTILKPNTYDITSTSQTVYRSPLINGVGYKNFKLAYKYKVFGEKDSDGTYDFGALTYFTQNDPTGLTSILDGPYVGVSNVVSGNVNTASVNTLAGTQFYIGFYWENDNNTGNNPGFNVDDIILTGDATKIETTVSNSYSYNVAGASAANSFFKSISSNFMIATLKSLSTTVSNITASVTEAGTDRLNIISGANSYLRSRKVTKVVPATTDNTTQYTTTLYFTTAEVAAWPNATTLKVIKINNGTTTTDNLNTTNSSLLNPIVDDRRTGEGYITYTVTTTGFGSFILVDAATVLPVSLLSFDAKADNNTVVLNWATSNEVNNVGFNVQRGINGSLFATVGFVASKNAATNNYTFTDATVTAGTRYYYRLQQKDIDGKTSLSNTVMVLFNGKNSSIKISPNPFNDIITVQYNIANAPITVTIFDVLGRKMYENKAAGTIKISTVQWSKGGYIIKINDGTNTQNYKIIKD